MTKGFRIGWLQVACCFVLLSCVSFIAACYSIIAVPLGQTFHPTRMVLMLAMTIMAGASGLLSPFLGSLMDRVSMRKVMVAGALFIAAGYAALSLTTSFTQVLIVFGLLIAPANVLIGPVAATVLISRWFTKRRGTAIGIAISGIAMGSVVYPPIIQGLLDHYEWRAGLQLFALLLLALALPAALLVVDNPAQRGLHPDGAAIDPMVTQPAKPAQASARVILTDPAFWVATAIFTTVLSGIKGMVTNLAPIAIDQGIKPSDAAFLISIYGMSGFIAKVGFAAVADRLNSRALMFLSLAGFAIGMACLTQASAGYVVIAIGVGFIGIGGGLMVPTQSFLVPRIFGAHSVGRAMGLMSTVMLVALLSTPPLFGRIFDVTGSYSAIFLIFIALAACSMAAVPYLRLQPRGERPDPAASPLAASHGTPDPAAV